MTVGRSWRTPIKHDYLWSIVGQEAGAVPHLGAQFGAQFGTWYDLTAGDAALIPGKMWHHSCSPGIPHPVAPKAGDLPDVGGDLMLFDLDGAA